MCGVICWDGPDGLKAHLEACGQPPASVSSPSVVSSPSAVSGPSALSGPSAISGPSAVSGLSAVHSPTPASPSPYYCPTQPLYSPGTATPSYSPGEPAYSPSAQYSSVYPGYNPSAVYSGFSLSPGLSPSNQSWMSLISQAPSAPAQVATSSSTFQLSKSCMEEGIWGLSQRFENFTLWRE